MSCRISPTIGTTGHAELVEVTSVNWLRDLRRVMISTDWAAVGAGGADGDLVYHPGYSSLAPLGLVASTLSMNRDWSRWSIAGLDINRPRHSCRWLRCWRRGCWFL